MLGEGDTVFGLSGAGVAMVAVIKFNSRLLRDAIDCIISLIRFKGVIKSFKQNLRKHK